MRITGGKARGIPLTTGRAAHVRPATDRMREAVFSSLGERVGATRVLDLFAGSGSYGLEALSRGASGAVFVEDNRDAAAAIQRNLEAAARSMGQTSEALARIVRRDALRFEPGETFDLVFMDPPYELARSHTRILLQKVAGLIAPGGLLVFEMPADMDPPQAGWKVLKRLGKRGINEPSVAILEKALA